MDIGSKIKAITQSDMFAKNEDGSFKCGTFVGRPYSLNYDTLGLLVCDDWKQKARGLPQGCFLLAFYKNEESISETLLLRVINPSKLPNDSDVISSMVEYYKDNLETTGPQNKLDSFTRYEFSFSGIECRVLGTFYKDEHNVIQFGADLENFYSSHNYEVYKPTPEYLGMIVNFTDKKTSEPFQIGRVRYSSSRRFQAQTVDSVSVYVLPDDFLGKRTAMFGMTRTGKSNSVKKVIQATCQMSEQSKHSSLQSGLLHDEIRRLREKYPDTPLYAVITDVCASGGYYVAAAADRIYADKASVVGSIGVLINSFGFVEGMQRLGVERRLIAAGRNKGLLDPFSPLREEEVAHMRGILDTVHAQFVEVVKKGRGERLKADPDLFTGLIWTGSQSLELGLVDGLGSAGYVAREVVGVEEVVDFTPRRSLLESVASRMGAAIGDTLATHAGLGALHIR